jgi:dihydrofolate reductase
MRKLILQMQVSVDGFVGRQDEGPSWQVWDWGPDCPWDQPLRERFNAFFVAADTILLSRRIVEGGYLDHWAEMAELYPSEPLFAFAERITAMRKMIFSTRLDETPWPGTELARKPLTEAVSGLKAERGQNIVAFGGAGFASALITAGVVDEIELYSNPVALGQGLSIFPHASDGTPLRLKSVDAFDTGIVVSTYSTRG